MLWPRGHGGTGAAGGGLPKEVVIAILVVVGLAVIIGLFLIGQFINLYIQALLSKAPIGIFELIGMRLRKVDIRTIVYSRIRRS